MPSLALLPRSQHPDLRTEISASQHGRLLVAKDVHDTFVRLLAPEFKSSGQWIMRTVRGANEIGTFEPRLVKTSARKR